MKIEKSGSTTPGSYYFPLSKTFSFVNEILKMKRISGLPLFLVAEYILGNIWGSVPGSILDDLFFYLLSLSLSLQFFDFFAWKAGCCPKRLGCVQKGCFLSKKAGICPKRPGFIQKGWFLSKKVGFCPKRLVFVQKGCFFFVQKGCFCPKSRLTAKNKN